MWWKSIMARGIFLFFACLFKHVNLNWLSRKESKFKIASRLADKTDFDNRYSKFEAWGYRIFHIWVTNSILWTSWPKQTHHWFDSKLSISILITTEAVRMFVMLWFFGDFNTNHLWKTMKFSRGGGGHFCLYLTTKITTSLPRAKSLRNNSILFFTIFTQTHKISLEISFHIF